MDPLCGATRARFRLARGHLGASVQYNPDVAVLAAAAVVVLLRAVVERRSSRRMSPVLRALPGAPNRSGSRDDLGDQPAAARRTTDRGVAGPLAPLTSPLGTMSELRNTREFASTRTRAAPAEGLTPAAAGT